jgi:hypothetical protein
LGGASVYRCDNRFVLTASQAAEKSRSYQGIALAIPQLLRNQNSDLIRLWEGHEFKRLRKNSDFDFRFEGVRLQPPISSAKSMPALAAEVSRRPQLAFFRTLFNPCRKS